ncbi:hypothetical protein MTO96_035184 [Rhipicephalus appendiculatus]
MMTQVMAAIPSAVAISDSDNDTIFDCLIANRTEIDYEAKKATQEIHFVATPARKRGRVDLIVGDDPEVKEGIFYFFNRRCLVMDVEYHGHQCVLWVQRYLMHNVPPVCLDHFVDTCGVVVAPQRRDLCSDD